MKKYLSHLKKVTTTRFILELGFLAFIIKIPAGIVGGLIVQSLGIHNPLFLAMQQEPVLSISDTFIAIIFAPIIETLFAQYLPIEIGKKFIHIKRNLIVFSATIFMIMHFPVIEFFPSAFMIGLILGWAWIQKKEEGLIKAFVIVTLIHALHNTLVTLTAALFL
ncbi:hypothetical protein A3B02_01995 [Candidatus Roizmanbacteria bacterium RIFCSPLOWO2_01_FULL_42_14]|uniref:CAAX prenyl protease 2/Lysostaphin resistance protein A-like domain-containing protein n=1 Tax=Candidatus Roizmanbacteria bacterium RIFCSPLOWO2_01_FULL_42_14 TaxID=1802068 RepID=A0A1F7JA41_9BACT|nr:MAG: hypothetical protein A3B02_01995 [Candidatus Roizmanbacteria bacterium RIFCSPLOWO2_01_FULL_42_14]